MTPPQPAPIDLRDHIRNIPDFPKPGIQFKDITPMLADPAAFNAAVDGLAEHFAGKGVDLVAAPEARGFLFGAPLALRLGAGFVPIRKPGKLPYRTVAAEYQLEYGTDRLEVHDDAFAAGRRVVLLDDVLATGGTMAACQKLVRGFDARVVGLAFVVELAFLDGRAKLGDDEIFSLITFS